MIKDLEAASSSPAPLEKHKTPEDQKNSLSFRSVKAVNIDIRHVNVDIDVSKSGFSALAASLKRKGSTKEKQWKPILRDINAKIPSGTLTAILGGSGSGKTSVLHAMSHRINSDRLRVTGSILYNDSANICSIRSAYVMQQDVLLPTLTVKETLLYAAELRLPLSTSADERRRVVDEVILELGLKECANTRIGNNVHKGCSGGEKRRTSLGVQMLANPSVLFLDEVTTGLDATSAHQLITTLKALASKGRTIIVTIHQPRSEIWGLFDRLLLLSGGSPIYSGPLTGCIRYFEDIGYDLPPFVNPAEYLIDLAAVDHRSPELEETSSARVDILRKAWKGISDNRPSWYFDEKFETHDGVGEGHGKNNSTALGRQVRVLIMRTLKVTWRDPLGMAGSLLEAFSMAIITGWIFLNLDGSLSGIRSREGALYTAASLQGYLILLFETYRLTIDIELFDREFSEGVVNVPSFLISRRIARIFVEDVPVPLIYSVIFYFMSNQIPVWMRWLKWTAYVFYAFGAHAANEFLSHTNDPQGQLYDCPALGGASNPACAEYTGAFVMDSLGFPSRWVVRPIIVLVAFVTAFYLGAATVLQYKRVGIGISRAQKAYIDTSLGKEKISVRSLKEIRTVVIRLDKYCLDIQKRSTWFRKSKKLSILKPLNTLFEPGILNVIMGPSGSGKTSLLNAMAHRIQNTVFTQYEYGGEMFFNNALPSADVVRSICSYVCQDDDTLLPYLTVRENLHFAAGLRLPTHFSKTEKRQRAESVLLKIGLSDCADNLVGSELVKGISGGEKRRVTIAIQILTDPRILLLDEPTSGLDAFTASSIMTVLKGLAEEGRTIVLTIHQSRSDLFNQFGSILLLARGGYPVYAGKGSGMLPHFESLGFPCPIATNPADFALDLITVNLQHESKEEASRSKVRTLIAEWDVARPSVYRSVSHIATPAELGSLSRAPTPFRISFPLLLRRSFLNFRRNPPSIIARTTQVLSFGIILTLFFAPIKNDYNSVQTRVGFIQEIAALYFVGMLQNVAVYPEEKAVFYREHDDNAYGIVAFFLQYTLAELPFEMLTSLLFALLTVVAAGLPRSTKLFFIVAFNCFAIVNCGESVGIIFNTLVSHTGFAVNLTSVVLCVGTIMGGVMSLNIPAFLQAWNHLSPIKWALGNLAPYTLRGVVFTCAEAQRNVEGRCPIETGEEVLRLYNLDTREGVWLGAVGVCVVVYRGLAFLILWLKRGRGWGVWWKGAMDWKGKRKESGWAGASG
ncbi:MAG: hypothetical protein LQ342_002168 [Letrouitia transgressa]|nr:MAG: hypothetical protein LQ342_002168 [Letrouitia transgressa]